MARKKSKQSSKESQSEVAPTGPLVLGLDIGTSKIAALLSDAEGQVVAVESRQHDTRIRSAIIGRSEQDAEQLLEIAWECIGALPANARTLVRAVGVSGQMHGVLPLDAKGRVLGPLVTWQDARCLENPGFLPELNAKLGVRLSSGYGCATAAWLSAEGQMPKDVAVLTSPGALASARLSGMQRPVVDPTDAASWGAFKIDGADWDLAALDSLELGAALFPAIAGGSPIGKLDKNIASALGLQPGIPVCAAIGDNQAALLATLDDPVRDLALTIGTGAQLSSIVLTEDCPVAPPEARWECRPFIDGRKLIVAASLSGGSAWTWLAETVRSWLDGLNAEVPSREALFARLNHLGLVSTTTVDFSPHFAGERFDPNLRATIKGLDLTPMDLGSMARGLACGIVRNLKDMMPDSALKSRKNIIASGNAMRRNPLLVKATEQVMDMQVTITGGREESALGAAIFAARSSGITKE